MDGEDLKTNSNLRHLSLNRVEVRATAVPSFGKAVTGCLRFGLYVDKWKGRWRSSTTTVAALEFV